MAFNLRSVCQVVQLIKFLRSDLMFISILYMNFTTL